jgi:uncharacterized membrane protein
LPLDEAHGDRSPGAVLKTSLSKEQDERLRKALAAA